MISRIPAAVITLFIIGAGNTAISQIVNPSQFWWREAGERYSRTKKQPVIVAALFSPQENIKTLKKSRRAPRRAPGIQRSALRDRILGGWAGQAAAVTGDWTQDETLNAQVRLALLLDEEGLEAGVKRAAATRASWPGGAIGLMSPGLPRTAASLAARVSRPADRDWNVYVACLYALAAIQDSASSTVTGALQCLPRSRRTAFRQHALTKALLSGRAEGRHRQVVSGVLGTLGGFKRLPDATRERIASSPNRTFRDADYTLQTIVESTEMRAIRAIERAGGQVAPDTVWIRRQRAAPVGTR